MIKILSDFIDYLNTIFININIKENLNETTIEIINTKELNELKEHFKSSKYKFGYSFFIEKKQKFYQQLIDYELIPDFIYLGKKYKYKDLKITPKFKGTYNSKEQYTLGNVVLLNKIHYINLIVPKIKKHKKVKFTNYCIGIPPLKKFADYMVWKKINFYKTPIKYKKSEILNVENIPKNIELDSIIDDSNPEKIITAKWRGEYQPFQLYSLGDVITFGGYAYINLLFKKAIQENPPKNLVSWHYIDIDIPPDRSAWVDPKKIPNIIDEGKFILPASEPKDVREKYKSVLAGEYDPNVEYKLGDIVLFNNKYYINLLKDIPFKQYKPSESRLQWKMIKYGTMKSGGDDEEEDAPEADDAE
jgi:hypothetical protein